MPREPLAGDRVEHTTLSWELQDRVEHTTLSWELQEFLCPLCHSPRRPCTCNQVALLTPLSAECTATAFLS